MSGEYFCKWQMEAQPFPNDYIAFDLETTGFQPEDSLIVQIGHCRVENRKPVDRGSVILDWTKSADLDQDWLKLKLEDTKAQIELADGESTGRQFPFTYERLKNEGISPDEALNKYSEMFKKAKAAGIRFVGHNAIGFDSIFIESHFKLINSDFVFDDRDIIDTGIIEKANQLDKFPWEHESNRAFSKRIRGIAAKGLCWNLDNCCVKKYALDKKYGVKLDDCHSADFDAYVTHLLLEEFRSLARAYVKATIDNLVCSA